jgi:hypothetical protein
MLLGNVEIMCTTDFYGECALYSSFPGKIISEKTINIIFGDSPKYDEIKKSINIYAKNGELYLPQKLKGKTVVMAEIDALVIVRGYSGELILYNFEFKKNLKKNINDERYIKARLQLLRSSIVLANTSLETEIIPKDSECYTFSILSSRDWYRLIYFLRCKDGDLFAYYVNHKNKSIEYQIPLNGQEMKEYANYSMKKFIYKMKEKGIIPDLLGLGNYKKRG